MKVHQQRLRRVRRSLALNTMISHRPEMSSHVETPTKSLLPKIPVGELRHSLAMRLEAHRENRRTQKQSKLLDLLVSFQSCRCREPRDKIFALLALATDCQNGQLMADYSKSLFAIYADVVQLYHPLQTARPRFWMVYYGLDLLCLSQLLLRMLRIPKVLNDMISSPHKNQLATFPPITCLLAGYITELGASFPGKASPVLSSSSSSSDESGGDGWEDLGEGGLAEDFIKDHTMDTLKIPLELKELKNVRHFFATSGRCGLATLEAQEGDLILQLRKSDFAAIVRLFDGHHHVVGRAFVFTDCVIEKLGLSDLHKEKDRELVAKDYQKFDYVGFQPNMEDETTEYFDLRLDIVNLQLLTR